MSSKDIETLTAAFALEVDALREAIVGSPNQWANALRVKGARPLQISRAAATPNLWNGDGRLMGWSLRETAGAAATVTFRDGDADGEIVGTVVLAANAGSTHLLPGGVNVGRALFAQVTGAVTGAVYFLD